MSVVSPKINAATVEYLKSRMKAPFHVFVWLFLYHPHGIFFIPGSGIVMIRFFRAAVQAQGNKVGKAPIWFVNRITVSGRI